MHNCMGGYKQGECDSEIDYTKIGLASFSTKVLTTLFRILSIKSEF